MSGFVLPESDSPLSFVDPSGTLWRFMPPDPSLSAEARRRLVEDLHLFDACEWLCYWYADLEGRNLRLIAYDLPCPHRPHGDRRYTDTNTVSFRGESFLAHLGWKRTVSVRTVSAFGSTHVQRMELDADTWRHIASQVGHDASWCQPVPDHLRDRVDDAVRLAAVFSMENYLHRLEGYLNRPMSSSDYREGREVRNRYLEELAERGWQETEIELARRWWQSEEREMYERYELHSTPNYIRPVVSDLLEFLEESSLGPDCKAVASNTSELLGW